LWVALALPGLHLLPGLGGDADASVAISLQSALLGIDDQSTQPADASLLASLRALGINAHGSLSAALSRTQSAAAFAPLVAQVDVRARDGADVSTVSAPPPPPHAPKTVVRVRRPAPPHVVPHVPGTHVTVPPAHPPVTSPPVTTPPVTPPPPAGLPGQTIVFTSTPPGLATVGGPAYIVAATASSGLAVVFSADPSSAGVCTVAGAVVSPVGVGTCTIDADQPGNASHLAAPRVQQSFVVNSGAPSPSVQSISFTSSPPPAPVVGSAPYTLAAIASSGLPVAYSTSPGSASACTLAADVVSFVGSGTCRIFADQSGNSVYLAAPQVQQVIVVGRVTQTITFTSTPPGTTTVGDPAYIVSATASSGLPVVFSADSSSAGVCTVSGSSVVAVGAGTCVIDANQFGDSTYMPAIVQQSFGVGPGAPSQSVQTIQFTSSTPAGAVIGGTPYTVTATASSGLAVAFSAAASSAGVCTVSGATVSFVGAGTCTVDANQAGDASYLAAPQVRQSFAVGLVAQAISFTSTPPSGALVGDPAYVVSATSSSGLPVIFTADASSAGVCTVSGSTVSLVGAGTCVIDADQSGNGTYQAAAQVQQSFAIATPSLSVQSINFTSASPSGAAVGGTYAVAATASSGLSVTFSVAPASAGVCTIAGATVSFVGTGTCTINANQAGDASYQAAPQVQQSFAVGLAAQTISFTSAPPVSPVIGDPAYTVTATATSGLAVTFSATAGSAGICTVSGATVSFIGAGTCTINANQSGNGAYQAAPQVQQSFTVSTPSASPQTINFTSTPPSGVAVGGAPYTVTATASSGLAVAFSIDASSAGVCTLAGATVSFVGVGTCTIDANQAGDASYQAAAQVQQSIAVGVTPQTISFTSPPPGGAVVGDPDYTVAATATSGLAVTFTVTAGSAGVCTISGATVTLVGAGTCTINANQAGNGTYGAAPQVQQSFAVGTPSLSTQTISFTSSAPAGATVGGATYEVSATASSGLAVTFTIAAGSAGVCTIAGSTVSFVGAGTCTIDANQAGNGSYQAAPQVQQSFAVTLASQTISFTSTPPAGAIAGDPDYTVSATATSGLPVTFTADASSAGICTVTGSSVSLIGTGTCVINANQAGDAGHQAAPLAQQSFSIGGAPAPSVQSITFTSATPSGATVGGSTYTVAATATSGLAVSFSIDASSAGVCTISGSTVSFVGAGTCTIDANQAGNGAYQAAPQVQQSFAVTLASQTISFTSSPPGGADVGGPTYTVSATASSGLAVTFTIAAGSAGVCTISGSVVSFVGAGTCTIDANQAGNGTYQAASQVQQSFTVTAPPPPSTQSISFTSTPPAAAAIGGAAYTVSASASSGLAVTFTIDASSAGVCTISGTTVSFVGAGSCTIDANQAGNGSYQAAPQVQQSFVVGLASQTISFTSSPPGGADVGGAPYTVSATASSGLAVTFTIAAASAGVCTISGSTVSFVGAGTCTINANQAGNGTYQAAPQVQQSFTVTVPPPPASPQTITFTSTPPPAPAVGGAGYTVSASASSGLAVTFTIDASSAGVCTISGATVSFVGTGTCTINANQAGNASYQAAPQEQQSFGVGLASQTISFTSSPPGGATVGGPTYTVAATASSGLAVTFSIAPASAGICSLSGSVVSFTGAGTCTVRANQAGNGTYAAAPQAQQSFTVTSPGPSKSVQAITFTSTPPSGAVVGGPSYTVTATASSGLAVTFTRAAASAGVCNLTGSTVTLVGAGTCTINADQAGDASYLPAPQAQQSFTVSLRSQTIFFLSAPPASAVVGGSTYTVSAFATSFLPVTFAVAPASAGVCTISGSTVSMVGVGTCVITANQTGNGTYQAAPQVQQSFTVGRGSQTITFTSTPPAVDKNDPPYTVTATASSGLAVIFTIDASSAGVCSISGSTVSFVGRGTCIIYANQPGDANWLPAPQVQQVFQVKNHTPG
jgi:hypothetical protein